MGKSLPVMVEQSQPQQLQPQQRQQRSWLPLLVWYGIWGALHECAHLLTAVVLGLLDVDVNANANANAFWDDGVWTVLARTLLLRQCVIPVPATGTAGGDHYLDYDVRITVVRHAGWIVSVLVWIVLALYSSYNQNNNIHQNQKKQGMSRHASRDNAALVAASLTALEAISTDLLGMYGGGAAGAAAASASTSKCVFLCGNFGIILLHKAWQNIDGGATALDILEKMVQVTMMRGAQSGGVVTFQPSKSGSSGKSGTSNNGMTGIRCRVLNQKRTDLSKVVRRKIERSVNLRRNGDVAFLAGHTRFATSSKATFEGTHPQRWTPPTVRRVYDFNVPHAHPPHGGGGGGGGGTRASAAAATAASEHHEFVPHAVRVENYITHNGDFDFYNVNGTTYDLEVIQDFLKIVLGPMPATVDSCAVAGMVDLLRTKGCFALSARYVICLGLKTSKMQADTDFPSYSLFEKIGTVFEEVLGEMLKATQFEEIGETAKVRHSFALRVLTRLEARSGDLLMASLKKYFTDEEGGSSLLTFCLETIHAFFDNDLFMTTKVFLKNAKGSFGLCVTSSLDANRQICMAARGQTMSIAFYPNKGLICYGSEQAAVKAGMNYEFPGGNPDVLGQSRGDLDDNALRLDLDDLGGEIIVLDWGKQWYKNSAVSKPNRSYVRHEVMNGSVDAILYQESKATTRDPQLFHRMTRLTRNRFIKPLQTGSKDLVLSDIQDIPKVCQAIQDEWRADKAATSLNRLTAYNLSRCLRDRLDAHVAGTVQPRAIDILLTGCEVSLWLSEQFAADLQKSFPNLRIKAVSSNKLLGLYGQELAVPALGFPDAPKTHNLHDTIIIIVSHSGGTFAPLACSNLLQSTTRNIFVCTSEWDTQIGKQLRAMDDRDDNIVEHIFNSRTFSTEVGMRPAEPCSVSVAATHQLLTNLFEYICVIILSNPSYRRTSAATITEQDLQVLEKCNRENISALCSIISVTPSGQPNAFGQTQTVKELRAAGDLWADHILENSKAYIMTFVYIFATVISGYPFFYGIALAAGFDSASDWAYFVRLFDAALYFWMPQINIFILRLIQGRNLRHRMVGRTVVIGDIPWVAQSAEAFLSKIFACSYSIAGVNVLSGNPVDHFVHRHTHRVVRGSLVICGRPDGRLSALSTAEASVCLSVNQASSIQSLGGTCESITIGHNPFKLVLSASAIFLKRKRPLFLCERMLVEADAKEEKAKAALSIQNGTETNGRTNNPAVPKKLPFWLRRRRNPGVLDFSQSFHDSSVKPQVLQRRSAAALLGAYTNFDEAPNRNRLVSEVQHDGALTVDDVVTEAIDERKWSDQARKLFFALDLDGNGFLSEEEFIEGSYRLKTLLSDEELRAMFKLVDGDGSGHLDYDEFLKMLSISDLQSGIKLPPSNHDDRGIIQIDASKEKYFGETLRKVNAGKAENDVDFMLARSQHFSQELYETRIASLQRFVSMTVMFHQMGKRVQEFFAFISFGMLGYRMDRTHSIMRIATTASPVSGADVRERMRHLQLLKKVQHSIYVISTAYLQYKARKAAKRTDDLERNAAI